MRCEGGRLPVDWKVPGARRLQGRRSLGIRCAWPGPGSGVRRDQSAGSSYLDLAQFLRANGDAAHTDADLEQLFRREAFNVAVGNRDDHLRNHGFVLGETGWRLAPAFDVNPNIDKAEHVLNIDHSDNRPSLETVLTTAAFYGLIEGRARQIVEEVAAAVDGWEDAAKQSGIARADVALTASAFSAHAEYRSGSAN